ncbi:MAG: thiamine pyrophosphate-dependent enzyme [Candidatus Helarchaeota archaeon]
MSFQIPSKENPDHPYEDMTYTGRKFNVMVSFFCSGCGYGSIAQMLNRIYKDNNLDQNKYPIINGVGCYTMIPLILPGKTFMVLHGRGPAVCTGIKLAHPEMKPISIQGDGDALSIGTNHFIHAARRNVDMVLLLLHNKIYGMTGGQTAPTTPTNWKASTAPYGVLEKEIDAVELALTAGATFVARWTTAHPRQFMKSMTKALLEHKGFSLIEIVSQCPTYFGRRNDMADPVELFNWIKENSVTIKKAESMSKKELKNKTIIGEFRQERRPTLSESYMKLIDSLDRGKK